MLKIRRPLGRLIFNMGIAIPGKTVFLIETAPWFLFDMVIIGLTINMKPAFPQILTLSADSWFAPCQWVMALLYMDIYHWRGANLESALTFSLSMQTEFVLDSDFSLAGDYPIACVFFSNLS